MINLLFWKLLTTIRESSPTSPTQKAHECLIIKGLALYRRVMRIALRLVQWQVIELSCGTGRGEGELGGLKLGREAAVMLLSLNLSGQAGFCPSLLFSSFLSV